MNNNLINGKLGKIVQSGAVGICILLIVLLGWVLNNFFNHLSDSVETQQELVGAVNQLEKTMDRLIDAINASREIKSI